MKTKMKKHYNDIEVCNLTHSYNTNGKLVEIFREINIGFKKDSITSIIGPNGVGKTTLLNIIAGFIMPDTGNVRIRGVSSKEACKQKNIGFVSHDHGLLPWMNVFDNVLLSLTLNRKSNNHNVDEDESKVLQTLDQLSLVDWRYYFPHQLSKGMCQRVSLARALVLDDVALILDEPMANLDELTREKLRYDLLEIFSSNPRTVILVTHNITESIQLSDFVIVLSNQPAEIVKSFEINVSGKNNLDNVMLPTSVEFNSIINNIRDILHEKNS